MAYGTERKGPGAWVILSNAQGIQLGYLWVSDAGSIGYVASSDAGVGKRPDLKGAFTAGANQGKTARETFDTWAAKRSGAVVAGPVRTGLLDLLPS
jgi:hypothetical protein